MIPSPTSGSLSASDVFLGAQHSLACGRLGDWPAGDSRWLGRSVSRSTADVPCTLVAILGGAIIGALERMSVAAHAQQVTGGCNLRAPEYDPSEVEASLGLF
jgi:hypothetical protein